MDVLMLQVFYESEKHSCSITIGYLGMSRCLRLMFVMLMIQILIYKAELLGFIALSEVSYLVCIAQLSCLLRCHLA